jgi:hypothetical protein
VIVETVSHLGRQTVMVQRFMPEIVDGDKRVLVIAGEVVPFALARIPKPGETRGNLAAGGRGEARPITDREREIAEALAPQLWAEGPDDRRPRRHRPVPDRGQRDVAHLLRRDRPAVRLRRGRNVRRRAFLSCRRGGPPSC